VTEQPTEPNALAAASLLAAGTVDEQGGQTGASAWAGRAQLTKLVRQAVTDRDLAAVLEDVTAKPQDHEAVSALAQALAVIATQDRGLRKVLARLVDQAEHDPVIGGLATTIAGHARVGKLVTIGHASAVHVHLPPPPPQSLLNQLHRTTTTGPVVANLPPRNPNFAGRAELLDQLHQRLGPGQSAAVVQAQALHGLGGVGKTELALEYAYTHLEDYDLVWWVGAEQAAAVPGQLIVLARRLGLSEHDEQVQTIGALWDALRQRDRWLLVFDNAEDPADLRPWWPPGSGRVLVTSRTPTWAGLAAAIAVDVLPRAEAVAFLQRRLKSDDLALVELAETLGDLPLALEQAAAYIEQTQMPLHEYLQAFRTHRQKLLDQGAPLAHDGTVNATVQLAADRVAHASQPGIELLRLCAFLAPDAIPLDLLTEDPEVLPPALASAATDWLDLQEAIRTLRHYSLADREPAGLRVHRLVQAVVEDSLSLERAIWVERVIRLLVAGWPARSYYDAPTWPRCAQLLPHVVRAAEHSKQMQVALESTAELLTEASYYARRRADYRAAVDLNGQALAIREAGPAPEDAQVGRNLANQGNALREQGRFAEARGLIERGLAIHQAALGPQHSETARDHSYLGSVLRDLGEFPTARAELERALAIHQATLGPQDPYVARDRANLGLVLHDLGDLTRARAEFERALEVDEAVYGAKHPEVARDCTFLGLVLLDLGDLAAAREQCQRALAIDEAALEPTHPHVARNHANLGLVLLDLGDLTEARAEFERALVIREAHRGPDHPDTAASLDNLGLVLQAQGDLQTARSLQERALSIREARLGPEHPLTAQSLSNLALVLRDQGYLDQARPLHERALAIREARLGADHPATVRSRRDLAEVVAELEKQQ
jgi:tetratricopeptide (TPR) repeat protein